MEGDLSLTTLVVAAGALGTAAFGIVDGMKWLAWLGEAGFSHIRRLVHSGFAVALEKAYGSDFERLLRAQYRNRDSKDEILRTLRQGIRLGLTADTAAELAKVVGVVSAEQLRDVAESLHSADQSEDGVRMKDAHRGLLGRFELAADTRIDAALALADDTYRASIRVWAGVVAVVLAEATALALVGAPDAAWTIAGAPTRAGQPQWLLALIIGVIAVPMAPIAKDVASGIAAAARALGSRK